MMIAVLVLFGVGFVTFISALSVALFQSRESGRFLATNRARLLTVMSLGWLIAIAGLVVGSATDSA